MIARTRAQFHNSIKRNDLEAAAVAMRKAPTVSTPAPTLSKMIGGRYGFTLGIATVARFENATL